MPHWWLAGQQLIPVRAERQTKRDSMEQPGPAARAREELEPGLGQRHSLRNKIAAASLRKAPGDELCLPSTTEGAASTGLPKCAFSKSFGIPQIMMLPASIVLPSCRELGSFNGLSGIHPAFLRAAGENQGSTAQISSGPGGYWGLDPLQWLPG